MWSDCAIICVCVCVSTHQSDLEVLMTDWSEDRSVGDVILKYVSLDDVRFVWFLFITSVFSHLSTSREVWTPPMCSRFVILAL